MNKRAREKVEYIHEYIGASNAATGSKYDANANVTSKNIATLSGELHKRENIMLNRTLMHDKISTLFNKELADEYIRQLEAHEIYAHDETSIKPYCVSANMYPFLFDGLTKLGGETKAPTNLDSYTGSFINLVFAIASQFAGAVATVEFLMYMDYFIRKDYGDDYNLREEEIIVLGKRPRTIKQKINDCFQQVVYSINQPAAARDYQSVFWNISIFDKNYFESIFEGFRFPDGTEPKWETLNWLQQEFMQWFNKERTKNVLTFPVVTMALLTDGEDVIDEEYKHVTAKELSEGHSFFIYMSDSADSLASCCRLRNEIVDNTFSYSLGAGGTSTGSINVISMNINRLVQKGIDIREQVKKMHKYQVAYRSMIQDLYDGGILPVYDAGFITLEKQFLTIGINGMVEAAEFSGIDPRKTTQYKEFVDSILRPIFEENKNAKEEYGFMFNTEFVPGESLGAKHAKWDREDGLFVPRDVYNSYFYQVENNDVTPTEKFALHGKHYNQFCDGGSALHLNLDHHLDYEQYLALMKVAVQEGTNYWTINVRNTICNDCGRIAKDTYHDCPYCGSTNIDFATRVIGYLKRVSNFSEARQFEESSRFYAEDK